MARKIAGMAEAHYAQIAPHLYCGPVVGAANIQLATCSPNFLILEGIGRWDGFHAEILKTPIRWEDGYVIPPTGPGLGVEIDEDGFAEIMARPWSEVRADVTGNQRLTLVQRHGKVRLGFNDVTVIRPIFLRGALAGYAANKAHHTDVGGMVPGSMSADAPDLFAEGLVMPPTPALPAFLAHQTALDTGHRYWTPALLV